MKMWVEDDEEEELREKKVKKEKLLMEKKHEEEEEGNRYCAMRILRVNEVTAVALTTTNSNKTGKLNCMYAMGTLLLRYWCCAAEYMYVYIICNFFVRFFSSWMALLSVMMMASSS